MSTPEALARITALLDKAGIAYMLSGSFASAYYGIPRSTQDIDVVIEASAAQLRTFGQSTRECRRISSVVWAVKSVRRRDLRSIQVLYGSINHCLHLTRILDFAALGQGFARVVR